MSTYLSSSTHLSADPQNDGTRDIFSAGGDNSRVSVIRGVGSNA